MLRLNRSLSPSGVLLEIVKSGGETQIPQWGETWYENWKMRELKNWFKTAISWIFIIIIIHIYFGGEKMYLLMTVPAMSTLLRLWSKLCPERMLLVLFISRRNFSFGRLVLDELWNWKYHKIRPWWLTKVDKPCCDSTHSLHNLAWL